MKAGIFPRRHNTVLSEVLVNLLEGAALTHGDALNTSATMRLAHHIHALRKEYNWPVEAAGRVIGCRDGRTETIAAYSLPTECIAAVEQVEREEFIRSVRQSRSELRSSGRV